MATIGDLPYELLYYIILLLVQSPGGAADFARIISVCRKFPLLLTQDDFILKHVNFDIELEFKNLKRYQHINSLLVKCSEAGNIAAQFLLGKGILVSSSQLLLGEWEKVVGSFMAYFLPKQVSTSEFSDKIGSLPACEVVLALRQPS